MTTLGVKLELLAFEFMALPKPNYFICKGDILHTYNNDIDQFFHSRAGPISLLQHAVLHNNNCMHG